LYGGEEHRELCDVGAAQRGGLATSKDRVVLFRKYTRVRFAERRRETKLSRQRFLEKMDFERLQLKEHCVANAIPNDEDEATLH
jgi:hypothetical protein